MGMRASTMCEEPNDREVNRKFKVIKPKKWGMLEFFAGSGLVSHGLSHFFTALWANDICTKKAAVYTANHKNQKFVLEDIKKIKGDNLPPAQVSWASFPCQDLSLAGMTNGINASRSGLVWEWLRVMDEMPVKPLILVAENVVGLVTLDGGGHYRNLHEALHQRGYRVGAVVIDAIRFLPQSRPRVFVIAVANTVSIPDSLICDEPNWMHPASVIKVSAGLPRWIWWNAPEPAERKIKLADIVEWDAPVDSDEIIARNLGIMSPRHKEMFMSLQGDPIVAAGYKRTRKGKQVLEARFDGVAGCLRTPDGGSSRQILIMRQKGMVSTRLLTVRETARLMGAPEEYVFPGKYNDGYRAMGDAVAAPVAEYLGEHILVKLVEAAYV